MLDVKVKCRCVNCDLSIPLPAVENVLEVSTFPEGNKCNVLLDALDNSDTWKNIGNEFSVQNITIMIISLSC